MKKLMKKIETLMQKAQGEILAELSAFFYVEKGAPENVGCDSLPFIEVDVIRKGKTFGVYVDEEGCTGVWLRLSECDGRTDFAGIKYQAPCDCAGVGISMVKPASCEAHGPWRPIAVRFWKGKQ